MPVAVAKSDGFVDISVNLRCPTIGKCGEELSMTVGEQARNKPAWQLLVRKVSGTESNGTALRSWRDSKRNS